MCERCTQTREEIMIDLQQLFDNHPDSRLMEIINGRLDDAVKEVIKTRIEPAIEAGVPLEMPPISEIREVVKATLVASVGAVALAAYAHATPGYTDEGGMPRAIILGMWAATVMNAEEEISLQTEMDEVLNHMRSLLGMGDN